MTAKLSRKGREKVQFHRSESKSPEFEFNSSNDVMLLPNDLSLALMYAN